MKKIVLFICLLVCLLPFSIFSQLVSGTVADKGGNKIGVYGQPNTDLNNVLFRNINVTFSIADQGAGNPTNAQIVLASGIPNLDLVPVSTFGGNPYVFGGRAYYSYIMSDNGITTTSTWPGGTKANLIADFTFPTNTYFPSLRLDDVSSTGGPNGQMYWYVEIIGAGDITDYNTMFFGTPGIPPTNNSGISPSFVPLQPITVIPVKFVDFTVSKANNDALLKWSVASEDANTDRYELERSMNGIDFSIFATVPKSLGNGTAKTYTSTDADIASRVQANNAIVYYRVKQIDKDGRFVYTEIRNLKFSGFKGFGATVFPNPVKEMTTVNIDLASASDVFITVIDALGKEVQKLYLNGAVGGNSKSINMSAYPAGTYQLKVIAGNETKILQVIKSK